MHHYVTTNFSVKRENYEIKMFNFDVPVFNLYSQVCIFESQVFTFEIQLLKFEIQVFNFDFQVFNFNIQMGEGKCSGMVFVCSVCQRISPYQQVQVDVVRPSCVREGWRRSLVQNGHQAMTIR